MSLINRNKVPTSGSVAFTFYFIFALALLAVAGYYIGINEQTKLFKDIVQKKQQQEDQILNSIADNQNSNTSIVSTAKNEAIKSLIDSPNIVLRNLRAGHGGDVSKNQTSNSNMGNVLMGPNVDANSEETQTILRFAKQAQYQITTNFNKNGLDLKLTDGQATGDTCYNTATERVCYPHYKLEKIWSVGDLNGDGAGDAIVSISAEEKNLAKTIVTDNFYAIISDPKSVTTDGASGKASGKSPKTAPTSIPASTSTAPISLSPSTVIYNISPFGFGVYSPLISSAEIVDSKAVLIGNFYGENDVLGSPTVGKAIRYKFDENNLIQKVGEAKLFKEQGESTSLWYSYNYNFDGLDFYFKAPDAWQRDENFDKGVKVTFKESGGRVIVLDTSSIIQTCSEYKLNMSDSPNVKIDSANFIDLGQFGVGSYVKYTIAGNGGLNQYHADICVNDKNNDKKVFKLYSTTNEDDVPYFIIFDKIWSTFKIKQN